MPRIVTSSVTSCAPEKATHFFQVLDANKRSRSKWQTTHHLLVGDKAIGESIATYCISQNLCTARDIKRQRVRIVKAYEFARKPFFYESETN